MKSYYLLSLGVLSLVGCIHEDILKFNGPGGDVVQLDPTGFIVNEQGYRHLLSEGGRPDMFTVVPNGYHITNGEWHDLNAIRYKNQP